MLPLSLTTVQILSTYVGLFSLASYQDRKLRLCSPRASDLTSNDLRCDGEAGKSRSMMARTDTKRCFAGIMGSW
jgi:hypothetical protein